jgi:hypothetical protein
MISRNALRHCEIALWNLLTELVVVGDVGAALPAPRASVLFRSAIELRMFTQFTKALRGTPASPRNQCGWHQNLPVALAIVTFQR